MSRGAAVAAIVLSVSSVLVCYTDLCLSSSPQESSAMDQKDRFPPLPSKPGVTVAKLPSPLTDSTAFDRALASQVCVCACVRACVCACACVHVCACVCVPVCVAHPVHLFPSTKVTCFQTIENIVGIQNVGVDV